MLEHEPGVGMNEGVLESSPQLAPLVRAMLVPRERRRLVNAAQLEGENHILRVHAGQAASVVSFVEMIEDADEPGMLQRRRQPGFGHADASEGIADSLALVDAAAGHKPRASGGRVAAQAQEHSACAIPQNQVDRHEWGVSHDGHEILAVQLAHAPPFGLQAGLSALRRYHPKWRATRRGGRRPGGDGAAVAGGRAEWYAAIRAFRRAYKPMSGDNGALRSSTGALFLCLLRGPMIWSWRCGVTFDEVTAMAKVALCHLPGGEQLRYEGVRGIVRRLPYPGNPGHWREAAAYDGPIPHTGWTHYRGCECPVCASQQAEAQE